MWNTISPPSPYFKHTQNRSGVYSQKWSQCHGHIVLFISILMLYMLFLSFLHDMFTWNWAISTAGCVIFSSFLHTEDTSASICLALGFILWRSWISTKIWNMRVWQFQMRLWTKMLVKELWPDKNQWRDVFNLIKIDYFWKYSVKTTPV